MRIWLKRNYFTLLIIGLTLNFLGSLILIFGALPSGDQINKISGTYFGGNKYLAENLEQNRKLAQIGLILSCAGFAFELVGTLSSKKAKE